MTYQRLWKLLTNNQKHKYYMSRIYWDANGSLSICSLLRCKEGWFIFLRSFQVFKFFSFIRSLLHTYPMIWFFSTPQISMSIHRTLETWSVNPNRKMWRWTECSSKRTYVSGTFLAAQWLRLLASSTGGTGWIPGWGAKNPHALWPKKKTKHKTEAIL